MTKFLGKYRSLTEVQAGMYKNQLNDTAVATMDTVVGIGVRGDIDEETVYQVTKAFWDNLDSVSSDAPWAKALNIEYSVQSLADMPLHAGAERYYREAGVLE